MATFSVIIPSQRFDLVKKTIHSVREQSYPRHEIEILVIANPPNSDFSNFFRETTDIRYFESEPAGINRAKNVGLRHARGEFVVFLDDDCTADDPTFFQKIYDLFKDPNIDGVGGFYGNSQNSSLVAKAYNHMANLWVGQFANENGITEQFLGGCSAYRYKSSCNYRFDENIRYGGDETGFNLQLIKAGQRLVLTKDLVVTHHGNGQLSNYIRRAARQGWNKGALTVPKISPRQIQSEFQNTSIGQFMKIASLIGFYQICGQGANMISRFFSRNS